MKKLLFIYNPHAGKATIRQRLGEVVEHFAAADYQVTLHPTTGPQDATLAAQNEAPNYDHVVCCGGDGTLNEVVTGLLQLEQPPTLGYLPAGTTNDFSRNLHLPGRILAAADCAVSGTPRPCDMGRFNDRHFVYVAAFGAFTDVSYNTPQEFKNVFGHLAYVLNGVSKLGSLKSYRLKVETDSETLEDDFIYGMVSNTVSVGGFLGLDPKMVFLDDGLFEVMLIKMPRSLAELNTIVTALLQQKPDGNVIGFQTARLTFTSPDPLPWTLDGEYGGDPQVAEIRNLPRAITVMQGK
jgi:YegS/Rv2252/BmrU family lipid kinase